MSVEECMEIIRRDRSYYDESGGGVTVSGGDPLLQSAFVRKLFSRCRKEGIHTCLESTFCVPWYRAQETLPVTDLYIADLKMMDPEKHRQHTGSGNEQILANLERLSQETDRIILRIPVIPGVNDDDDNIRRSADFILEKMQGRIQSLQLLSFMFLGEEKYRSLGMPYPMEGLQFDREAFQEKVKMIADYFISRGIDCMIGNKRREQ
jgi:pyruvate formate lyase activating enzyme